MKRTHRSCWLRLLPMCLGVVLLVACQVGQTAQAPSVPPATTPAAGSDTSPVPATDTPAAPTVVPTAATPSLPAPAFLYVHETALLAQVAGGEPQRLAELPDLGAVLDARRVGEVVFVLCERGLQRAALGDGSSEVVVRFDPPVRFGSIDPLPQGTQILYEAVVDDPQAEFGMRTEIGLYQADRDRSQTVLSTASSLTVLGMASDGRSLYLVPHGQDPSFGRVLVVALDGGQVEAELDVLGDPIASLAPDSRFLVATMPQDVLNLYDLASATVKARRVSLPNPPSHVRDLFWASDGRSLYFSLLGGDFYSYDPLNPPDPHGLWRLEVEAGTLTQVTTGEKGERQLLAMSPGGEWLVTGDLAGTVQVWEARSGREMGQARAPQGEMYAAGISPDGDWLLLRHFSEEAVLLVHLPGGESASFTLPAGAVVAGWR